MTPVHTRHCPRIGVAVPADPPAQQEGIDRAVEQIDIRARVVRVEHGEERAVARHQGRAAAVERPVCPLVLLHHHRDRISHRRHDLEGRQKTGVGPRLSRHHVEMEKGQHPRVEPHHRQRRPIRDIEAGPVRDALGGAVTHGNGDIGDLDVPFHEDEVDTDAERRRKLDASLLEPAPLPRRKPGRIARRIYGGVLSLTWHDSRKDDHGKP